MNLKLIFLMITLLSSSALTLYGANSKVVKLTQANFKEKVTNSKEPWIVEFYAPWCGHCKSMAPAFEKAAMALGGMVNLGAVDMTTDQQVGSPYNVQGFPTIKLFGANKNSPKDHNGGR
jgi:protein disulfide-isomerase A6